MAERPNAQFRLGLGMVVALVPSIALVVGLFEAPGWYSTVLVFTATAMLVLAFARIGERIIREAVAGLADAHTSQSVTAVIRRSIEKLVRPGSVQGVTLSSLSATRRGVGLPPDRRAWTLAVPVGGDARTPAAGEAEPSLLFVRGNRRALERAEQVAATVAGCDFGQGFRFSPPLPDAEVLDWIAACAGRAG